MIDSFLVREYKDNQCNGQKRTNTYLQFITHIAGNWAHKSKPKPKQKIKIKKQNIKHKNKNKTKNG